MAKTTAPLLSFGGSGSIAKTMVYSSWKGIPYVRRHVIPANPQTANQQAIRTMFALLREMYKLSPPLALAPWTAFATGRPFTGMNKYVGENIRVMKGESDMQNFIASPGARGGLPPTSFGASTGAGSGEIDCAFTNPGAPTGWTLASAVAVAFPDQDPTGIFSGPIVAGEDAVTFNDITLTGLGSAVDCIVCGWLQWTKPDNSTAYSVSLLDTATSGA